MTIKSIHFALSAAALSMLMSACAMRDATQATSMSTPAAANHAAVSVDFGKPVGPLLRVEKFSNVSRPTTFTAQRDADVQFYNEQGLHGKIYRVWIDEDSVYDHVTGTYHYEAVDDYLADLSRLSDSLLVVMDTRVAIRDRHETPAQIKPIIRRIMGDLKQRYPHIRYIEAFNEPDYNLAKVVTPESLYDYYIVYYEAVNEINQELKPSQPLEVGGPAFMQFKGRWMPAFLDRYQADPSPDKRLDFISYHGYGEFPPGDGGHEGPRAYHFFKGNPSEVAGQRAQLEADLRSRGLSTEIPSFVTELGIYPGPSFDHPKDPRPDYLIQAAGVSSLLYWFEAQPHTIPFNWVLRHKTEERKDQLVSRSEPDRTPIERTFTPYGNAMLMMSKLKDERVSAVSNALDAGKGVYAIATSDESGVAIMVWNYQGVDTTDYQVEIDMSHLPAGVRGKAVQQTMYRIDDKLSNYWADHDTANLQKIADTPISVGDHHRLKLDLPANALQLIVLEPSLTLPKTKS